MNLIKLNKIIDKKLSKVKDWEDSYNGVKFETFCDPETDKYDIWLYLKQGKTLIAKDKDFGASGPKNFIYDSIDKAIKEKKTK